MHILIGLAMGVALLYGWLIGWWFARVLMVILCVPLVGCLTAWAFTGIPGATQTAVVFGGIVGIVAGWFLAGWPVYYWEGRNRRYREALDRHPMQDWHRIPY